MSDVPAALPSCPTPDMHETFRYCPNCTWTEADDRPAPVTGSGYCDNEACTDQAAYEVAGGVQVAIDAAYHEISIMSCRAHLDWACRYLLREDVEPAIVSTLAERRLEVDADV